MRLYRYSAPQRTGSGLRPRRFPHGWGQRLHRLPPVSVTGHFPCRSHVPYAFRSPLPSRLSSGPVTDTVPPFPAARFSSRAALHPRPTQHLSYIVYRFVRRPFCCLVTFAAGSRRRFLFSALSVGMYSPSFGAFPFPADCAALYPRPPPQ